MTSSPLPGPLKIQLISQWLKVSTLPPHLAGRGSWSQSPFFLHCWLPPTVGFGEYPTCVTQIHSVFDLLLFNPPQVWSFDSWDDGTHAVALGFQCLKESNTSKMTCLEVTGLHSEFTLTKMAVWNRFFILVETHGISSRVYLLINVHLFTCFHITGLLLIMFIHVHTWELKVPEDLSNSCKWVCAPKRYTSD